MSFNPSCDVTALILEVHRIDQPAVALWQAHPFATKTILIGRRTVVDVFFDEDLPEAITPTVTMLCGRVTKAMWLKLYA